MIVIFAEIMLHGVAMMTFEVTMKKLPLNQKKISYLHWKNIGL